VWGGAADRIDGLGADRQVYVGTRLVGAGRSRAAPARGCVSFIQPAIFGAAMRLPMDRLIEEVRFAR
jgi:hypothetical protein